jgi:hypothetical protein
MSVLASAINLFCNRDISTFYDDFLLLFESAKVLKACELGKFLFLSFKLLRQNVYVEINNFVPSQYQK